MRWLAIVIAAGLAAIATTAAADDRPRGPDWRPSGEAQSYDRKTVYQAIDGAADLFVAYDFRSLREQTWTRGALQATVQVYEQGSPLDAFGVFARERPPGAQEVSVGAGGAAGKDGECLAYKGARYFKALPAKGKLDRDACRTVLAAVAKSLPGASSKPRELQLLPSGNQVPDSVGYTRGSFLGTRQLGDCVHADYKSATGARYTLFVLVTSGTRTADAIWRELAGKWKLERAGKVELLTWRHPYKGTVGVARRSGAIVGAAGVGDSKATAALLEKL
jgi:hypothetical protein